MSSYRIPLIAICILLLAACSEEPATEKPKEQGHHIWEGQVEMLNEAKQVGEEVNALQLQKEKRLNERE